MTREFSRKEVEYDIKERLIQTLEKHIKFLEEELRRKDTIITSLIDKQIPKEIEKQKQKQKQNEPSRPGKTPINPPTLQNEQGGVSNENTRLDFMFFTPPRFFFTYLFSAHLFNSQHIAF